MTSSKRFRSVADNLLEGPKRLSCKQCGATLQKIHFPRSLTTLYCKDCDTYIPTDEALPNEHSVSENKPISGSREDE